jgi:hypothetical protein
MSASLLPAPANQAAIISALPPLADDSGSCAIVQFVRALAIRQARSDAGQAFKVANDNERGTSSSSQ